MEILFEILGVVLQFAGEILFQLLFEVLAEAGLHSLGEPFRPARQANGFLATLGYAIYGSCAGGLSLLLRPDAMIHSQTGQWLNLLVTPLVCALVMGWLGAWRRRRGQELIRLDRASYAYVFALGMALVRFLWTN